MESHFSFCVPLPHLDTPFYFPSNTNFLIFNTARPNLFMVCPDIIIPSEVKSLCSKIILPSQIPAPNLSKIKHNNLIEPS